MEWIGIRIRRQRRRLGLSLEDLARRARMSKGYLSLLETGQMRNPPSDEKLNCLSAVLKMPKEILLVHARLLRTPPEVRLLLEQLISGDNVDSPINCAMRDMLRMPEAELPEAESKVPRVTAPLKLIHRPSRNRRDR